MNINKQNNIDMTHEQMIEVIQAHKEGKIILFKDKNANSWNETNKPFWDFHDFDYSIKPEDKYIPFTFDTNLVGKTIVNKNSKNRFLIYKQAGDGVYISNGLYTYDYLLDNFTFLDNTPCGNKQ